LQEACEPGGLALSNSAHDSLGSLVDVTFVDDGEQRFKNIARPIRVWRWSPETPASITGDGISLSLPDKPSIAVLPFDNMSNDPEQEYFSDGITEDIITELSRFRSLFVIARNSSFVFKGQAIDIAEIGDKLGVQYVVEGSVRKAGDRVRVTAQLIDAATSRHLWAERYDRELKDIFAVQDEITQTIVSTLPGRLEEAGRERAEGKQTASMTAYDHLLLGRGLFNSFTRERIAEARQLAQKAVALDPNYARAHALIAGTHLWDLPVGYSTEDSLTNALASAKVSVELDDEDSWSHAMFAMALFENKQDEEAEIQGRRAVALNANDADANAMLGVILVYLGRIDEGREWIEKAMRLNPFPPEWYHWYRALAYFSGRSYEEAIHAFKEIRSLDRWGHAYIAACHAHLKELEEARTEVSIFVDARRRELLERGEAFPSQTLELARVRANRYRIQADRDHLLEGLRKAGLSE
jgi:TolB-like protein